MNSKDKLYWFAGSMAVLAVFIFSLPIWIVHVDWIKTDYGTTTGTIGDTMGGFWGPGMGFVGAILTFVAFYVQYRANQMQRDDIKRQTNNWKQERFESRFFELLKLHKDNVGEMKIDMSSGRQCFVDLFDEFKIIYDLLKIQLEELKNSRNQSITDVRLVWIAYNCFFHGIKPSGEKAFISDFSAEEQEFYTNGGRKILEDALVHTKLVFDHKEDEIPPGSASQLIIAYLETYAGYISQGQAHRLGHYYRHLFQTVKYIDDSKLIEQDEKVTYMKTLRAQLTNYEQLMLFHNAIVWFPELWKRYFTNYRFIKNIPLELCEMGKDPKKEYQEEMIQLYRNRNGKKMFEGQGDISLLVSQWEQENITDIN